jgi:hypothetical protein
LHASNAPAARQIFQRIERVDHFRLLADGVQAFLNLVHCPACLAASAAAIT